MVNDIVAQIFGDDFVDLANASVDGLLKVGEGIAVVDGDEGFDKASIGLFEGGHEWGVLAVSLEQAVQIVLVHEGQVAGQHQQALIGGIL